MKVLLSPLKFKFVTSIVFGLISKLNEFRLEFGSVMKAEVGELGSVMKALVLKLDL